MSITLVAGLGNPGRGYARTPPQSRLGRRRRPGPEARARLADRGGLRGRRGPLGPRARGRPLAHQAADVHERQRLRRRRLRPVPPARRRGRSPPSTTTSTIELGRVKVSVSGSAGGHNGVASLLEHLGDGFVRFRLGVGPKEPPEMDLKDFVLSKFTFEQRAIIDQKLDLLRPGTGAAARPRRRPGHEPAQSQRLTMNPTANTRIARPSSSTTAARRSRSTRSSKA